MFFYNQKSFAKCRINDCNLDLVNKDFNDISNRFKTSFGDSEYGHEKIVLNEMKSVLSDLNNTISTILDKENEISENNIKVDVKENYDGNKSDEDIKSINIESDLQYVEGNIFVAEGNVYVSMKGKNLQADKFIFDKEKKILKILGNIRFVKAPFS